MNNPTTHSSSETTQHSGRSYIVAFFICIILTIIPFMIIGYGADSVSKPVKMAIIAVFALLQLIIQMVYFLHLKDHGDPWNKGALAFTLVLVAIIVGGSAWIMYNLNVNMMMH